MIDSRTAFVCDDTEVNDKVFRVSLQVKNPTVKQTAPNIKVTQMTANGMLVIGKATTSAVASLSDVTLTGGDLRYSFGLKEGSFYGGYTAKMMIPVTLDNGLSNSVRRYFKSATPGVSGNNYKVKMDFVGAANSYVVLAGSVAHNLPDFSSTSKVDCYLDTTTTAGTVSVICKDVGALVANTDYYIGFKVNLAKDTSETSATVGAVLITDNTGLSEVNWSA